MCKQRIFLAVLALILSCGLSYAQKSELYVTVVFDSAPRRNNTSFPRQLNYDIQLSNDTYSIHRQVRQINPKQAEEHGIFTDLPESPISVNIWMEYEIDAKPLSDTIALHKGTNAAIIELDTSGEHTTTLIAWPGFQIVEDSSVNYYNKVALPDGKIRANYRTPKPARPRVRTEDGNQIVYSSVFGVNDGDNPAIDIILKNKWGELVYVPGSPFAQGLMITDHNVHWSWKNGIFLFWKE